MDEDPRSTSGSGKLSMTGPARPLSPPLRIVFLTAVVLSVFLMVTLRIVALDSDPYPRLSWSSGLLTDEGYYVHNARNLVLFGTERTDGFNNMLIMPTLHFVQVVVFWQWGAGAVPARMISVVCSLLTIMALFAAVRRAFNMRVALFSALFVGLDHVNLLYNRMALMDTPAEMLLVAAFVCWVYGTTSGQRERSDRVWLIGCGVLLAVAFVTRGLAVIALPAPFLAVWIAGRGHASLRTGSTPSEHVDSPAPGSEAVPPASLRRRANAVSGSSVAAARRGEACISVGAGMAAVLVVYTVFWYLPHRSELAEVNRYYLWHQLLPNSAYRLGLNLLNAWFGDERGAAPFFMRHTPIVFVLSLGGLVFMLRRAIKSRKARHSGAVRLEGLAAGFVWWWLALAAVFLSTANYSPSRYYLLFYPAMAISAGVALDHIRVGLRCLLASRLALFLLGAYVAYHAALLVRHHGTAADAWIVGATALAGGVLSLGVGSALNSRRGSAQAFSRMAAALTVGCWLLINGGYLSDWLTHLEYAQRDASRWLAAALPAGSVVIGDVAPGLCLYNNFEAISVIPGLCNDRQPVERFHGRTRAIVILDGPLKERWWTEHYPRLVAPEKRVRLFPRIGRFPVGVYMVNSLETAGGAHKIQFTRKALMTVDEDYAQRYEH